MSATDSTLHAKARDNAGKGASRRLRRLANEVPAIVYGGKKNPQNISLVHDDLAHALENEAFFSQIISLNVDGKTEDVILKDLQRHPAKPLILHADFFRVSKKQAINVKVPLHFMNEENCIGVKQGHGSIAHNISELEITCLPGDLPEYLEVDMAGVDIGDVVHISDIKLPQGVTSVALSQGEEHDLPVATVNAPRAVEEGEETSEEASEKPAEEGSEESGEE